jgi:hypothetical protein
MLQGVLSHSACNLTQDSFFTVSNTSPFAPFPTHFIFRLLLLAISFVCWSRPRPSDPLLAVRLYPLPSRNQTQSPACSQPGNPSIQTPTCAEQVTCNICGSIRFLHTALYNSRSCRPSPSTIQVARTAETQRNPGILRRKMRCGICVEDDARRSMNFRLRRQRER